MLKLQALVMALAQQDIEAELSYAYLHAVVSRAGMVCREATRLEDNAGIDASLCAFGPFQGGGYLTEIDLKVQLKATTKAPGNDADSLSYFVCGPSRYDALRQETIATPRILVVLFLPRELDQWLEHTPEQLVLRHCAYWVSLRGAPATDNSSGATVKIPRTQVFSPTNLTALIARISRQDIPIYQENQ